MRSSSPSAGETGDTVGAIARVLRLLLAIVLAIGPVSGPMTTTAWGAIGPTTSTSVPTYGYDVANNTFEATFDRGQEGTPAHPTADVRSAVSTADLVTARAAFVAADSVPELTIDDAQFGAKVGKHAQDYGLSPSDPPARTWVRSHIEDIVSNPDEVRQGAWNPKAGGGSDYWFFQHGSDVVVTRGGGQFVTILKGGVPTAGSRTRRRNERPVRT